MSGRRYSAALFFTAMTLAGCSLVEQVIVVEHRKETARPYGTLASKASAAPILKCSHGAGAPGCSADAIAKTYSADYDSGPVLKPIRKVPENKPAEAREDSAFVGAVKSWIKAGMQFPGWIASQ